MFGGSVDQAGRWLLCVGEVQSGLGSQVISLSLLFVLILTDSLINTKSVS